MAELTVIIPFCNEGEEVGLTIKSCKEFAKGEVDFLLIDDYSSDNYDYMSVVKEHNCQFIRHNKQLGVSPSRDDGVNLCKSPYFVLLDGHMAMLQQGWDECVLSYVKTDPRAIWCGQTQCLQANREVMPPTASFGAKITPAFNAE
jgi:glycosyltransferase involved in cell wall biosynthesis